MLWMMYNIRNFILLCSLVVDFCARVFSVTKAYIHLPHLWRSVGCDLDLERVFSSLLQLALAFDRTKFNKDSDIIADDYLQKAASMFFKAIKNWT